MLACALVLGDGGLDGFLRGGALVAEVDQRGEDIFGGGVLELTESNVRQIVPILDMAKDYSLLPGGLLIPLQVRWG